MYRMAAGCWSNAKVRHEDSDGAAECVDSAERSFAMQGSSNSLVPLAEEDVLRECADGVLRLLMFLWTAHDRARSINQVQVTRNEFLVLDILSASDCSLTVGEIQCQAGVGKPQMTQIIHGLESGKKEPLVICSINSRDRRRINVELTTAGREARDTYLRIHLRLMEASFLGLSAQDLGSLAHILKRTCRPARDSL